jgi:hypothetical protein
MLQGSLVCSGIDPIIAVKDYWCVSYNPSDPICGQYQQPICSDLVENQSVACTLPHYSGVINQNRTYSCATNSWSPWIEASNNCTPDPPTCQASMETRQLACQADYVGSVTETRQLSCPDPYGSQILGAWVETNSSCVKSATNVTNVASPVSPSSPLNPVNNPPPMVAPPPPPMVNPLAGPMPELPKVEMPKEQPKDAPKEQPKEQPKDAPKTKEDAPKDQPKQEQKQEKTEAPKIEVPKGKELVPGFGIVLSLDILNKPLVQQIQITDAFKFEQGLNDDIGKTQNFQLELIQLGTSQDDFNSFANSSWKRLHRYNLME